MLTENVSDLARLCGEHAAAGRHHRGVLIALSSRSSPHPVGYGAAAGRTASSTCPVEDLEGSGWVLGLGA